MHTFAFVIIVLMFFWNKLLEIEVLDQNNAYLKFLCV